MNKLSEVGNFIHSKIPYSLRNITTSVLNEGQAFTLRNAIERLKNLEPFVWEPKMVNQPQGVQSLFVRVEFLYTSGLWLGGISKIINLNNESTYASYNSPQFEHLINQTGKFRIEVTAFAVIATGYIEDTRTFMVEVLPFTGGNGGNGGGPSNGNGQPPNINVTSSAGGVFNVKGSGFLPNKSITIRVVDDAYQQQTFTYSSSATGSLDANLQFFCIGGLALHFSASDGRSNPGDVTGVLWSNTFHVTCIN